jgi:dihydroflavonol-4-reductase
MPSPTETPSQDPAPTAHLPSSINRRHVVLFGATGFIGRWTVKELLDQGATVTAALRNPDATRGLADWLRNHGTRTSNLRVMPVDFRAWRLGIGDSSLAAIGAGGTVDVINVAGAYAFGMSTTEAVRANVESAQAVAEFAATLPDLRRLVHLSGYRVGGQEPAAEPWSDAERARIYKRLGAYEASKVEGDAVVQGRAQQLGIALTVVNPATVTGHSVTGETSQVLGLATTLHLLWRGELRAMAGGARTFVPVVPVDYLAQFLAMVPTDDSTKGQAYWVLDDNTPTLTDLLTLLRNHYQVPVPRLRIPVGIVKRLPSTLTGVEPETLGFLSSDQYPTHPARELAEHQGLAMPDTIPALKRWADYLAAHHFGSTPAVA